MCKPGIRPREELLKNLHAESVKLLEAEVNRRFPNPPRHETDIFVRTQKICPDVRRVTTDENGRLKTFYPAAWRILGDVADSMSEFPDTSTTQVTFCQSIIDVPYANVLLLVHSLLDPDTLYEKDVTEALEQFVGIRRSGDGAIFPSSESALGDMSEVLHERWDEITQPEREVGKHPGLGMPYGGSVSGRWASSRMFDLDTGEAFEVPAAKVTRHEDVAEIKAPYLRTPVPVGNNFTLGRGKLSISRDGGKTFEELPYDVKSFSFTPELENPVEGKMDFRLPPIESPFTDGPDAGKPIGTTFPWPKPPELDPDVCPECGRDYTDPRGCGLDDDDDEDDYFDGTEPETPEEKIEAARAQVLRGEIALREFEEKLIEIVSKTLGIPEEFLRSI